MATILLIIVVITILGSGGFYWTSVAVTYP